MKYQWGMPTKDPKNRWFSTPQKSRKRKMVTLTLSDDARARLAWLVQKTGRSASELVEDWIMEAEE